MLYFTFGPGNIFVFMRAQHFNNNWIAYSPYNLENMSWTFTVFWGYFPSKVVSLSILDSRYHTNNLKIASFSIPTVFFFLLPFDHNIGKTHEIVPWITQGQKGAKCQQYWKNYIFPHFSQQLRLPELSLCINTNPRVWLSQV